jgi:RHS repeat-associated protein
MAGISSKAIKANFEEGRIRVMQAVSQNNGYDALTLDGNMDLPGGKRGAYDYYIRDYQENVRMILTEEVHTGSNQCTMETARATSEEPIFGQAGAGNEVATTRFAVNQIPGQTTGGGWQNVNIGSQVSRLSALSKKTGPNALLKVMAGDQLSAMSQYWYQNPVSNGSGSTLVSDVVSSLLQAITGSAATSVVTKEATTNISTQLNANTPFKDLVAPDANNTQGTNPKAYLTVIFFDERFNYVGEGSAFQRVVQTPGSNASLVLTNIKAPKNGYAFVYLSNESSEPVYFDNFQVVHSRGRIIEENHYYSFGLKIAAISSKKLGDTNEGLLQNNYQYQGSFSEMDEDIGWNDFALRNYDPQIGRFIEQDPFQQFASPYTGMGNNPVNTIDPSGGETLPFLNMISSVGRLSGEVLPTVVVTAARVVNPMARAVSTLQVVMRTASIVLKVAEVSNTICKAVNTDPVGNRGPTPYEGALLSKAVYGERTKMGGWSEAQNIPSDVQKLLENPKSGFKAKLYQKTINGELEYTLAFAGTEPSWKDRWADVKQGVGLSKQYDDAVKLATLLTKKLRGNLTYVGHSLGGGLASLAALTTGNKALTYNSAALSYPTMLKYGVQSISHNNINAYIIWNEPLNYFQKHNPFGIPQAQGNINYLYDWTSYFSNFNPFNHSIDKVIDQLKD